MDEVEQKKEQLTDVAVGQQLGTGVKILLAAIVVGAVVGGVYAAVTLAK